MIPLALAFHTMAAIIWVGGMVFTLWFLRPALAAAPKPTALGIWRAVLGRFFTAVWASIAVLLGTGYGVVFFGYDGFAAVGIHVHIMQATGLTMVALFALMWAKPWQDFRRAVAAGQPEAAAKAMKQIRLVVMINMPLGLFTAAIGATGGFWAY